MTKTKLAKKKPATKKPVAKTPPTKKSLTKKVASEILALTLTNLPAENFPGKTDEEKRLARNEALRVWRKANKERVDAYMKAWREMRKDKAAKSAPKKATAKNTKKGGTA